MLFFFFKQKTAYEMRISDWSSDVCSSDLMGMDRGGVEPLKVEERNRGVDHEAEDPGAEHVPEGDRDEAHQGPAQRAHPRCPVAQAPMLPRLVAEHDQRHDLERAERRTDRHHREIARASCRERVCQYV